MITMLVGGGGTVGDYYAFVLGGFTTMEFSKG